LIQCVTVVVNGQIFFSLAHESRNYSASLLSRVRFCTHMSVRVGSISLSPRSDFLFLLGEIFLALRMTLIRCGRTKYN
jgi:hypothetical protein